MSREVVDAWFDAFREQNISKLKLAEDFVHTSPFGVVTGREVYLNLVKENADAFFSRPIEIIDIIGDGDKFAVRYVVGEMNACDCIYVQGGEISKIYSYYHVGAKLEY